jgi:hypothetical protein
MEITKTSWEWEAYPSLAKALCWMYVETDTRMKKIMVRYFVEKAMEERRDGVCYQKEAIALDTPFTSVPECCR